MGTSKEKYYQPDISEFHVGFEYERTVKESTSTDYIEKHIATKEDIANLVVDDGTCLGTRDYFQDSVGDVLYVRVKYLDKEDIESLGFEHVGAMWFKIQSGKYRLRWWKNHEVDIWKGKHDMENMIIFRGTIRNKSELKRLMKQLNIVE